MLKHTHESIELAQTFPIDRAYFIEYWSLSYTSPLYLVHTSVAYVDTLTSMIDRVQSNGQYTGLVKSACMTIELDNRQLAIKQRAQAQAS
jgi:hypothetical protein